MLDKEVLVIGAGLAGSEAAWQIANSGTPVIGWDETTQSITCSPHK